MLKRLRRLLGIKSKFVEWDTYKRHIDFLDMLHWQQSVRKHNVEILLGE